MTDAKYTASSLVKSIHFTLVDRTTIFYQPIYIIRVTEFSRKNYIINNHSWDVIVNYFCIQINFEGKTSWKKI